MPEPVKLTTDDFTRLKRSGDFAHLLKFELLDGRLFGVPHPRDDEPWSDWPLPVKLRVDDYLRLAAGANLLGQGKTELIDGLVYKVSPQHRRHMRVKSELAYRLRVALQAIGSSLFVGVEGTVAMPPHDAPEPDIILTNDPEGDGPVPVESVALLVEVSDTTAEADLARAPLCAAQGVPEYWVVDLPKREIHRMWTPGPDGYAKRDDVGLGERIESATVTGLGVETDGLV